MSYAGIGATAEVGGKGGSDAGGDSPWFGVLQTGLQSAPGIIGAFTGHPATATTTGMTSTAALSPSGTNFMPLLIIGGVAVLGGALLLFGRRRKAA
jgi:membrane anchored protein